MSTGYAEWNIIKRTEEAAERIGFQITACPYNSKSISLRPKKDKWTAYNPDMDIISGSFEELYYFILGIEKAHFYDDVIRLSNSKKRKKAEENELKRRNQKKMLNIIQQQEREQEPPF